jgi:hypothetical protein
MQRTCVFRGVCLSTSSQDTSELLYYVPPEVNLTADELEVDIAPSRHYQQISHPRTPRYIQGKRLEANFLPELHQELFPKFAHQFGHFLFDNAFGLWNQREIFGLDHAQPMNLLLETVKRRKVKARLAPPRGRFFLKRLDIFKPPQGARQSGMLR